MSPHDVLHSSEWTELVSRYQQPDLRRSIAQICNSFLPFIAIVCAMLVSLRVGYWLTLGLSVPAAGFLVRIFIIQHDCGHASFFRSARANNVLGFICGVVTLTPYRPWRLNHAIHHRGNANLARRSIGSIHTLTVNEYRRLSRWRRAAYRAYRHPLILFVAGSLLNFVVVQRFWLPKVSRELASLLWTNLGIACLTTGMVLVVGLDGLLLMMTPVLVITFTVGAWLFYVQHQFEETYWARDPDWSYTLGAMRGSSYYRLPGILRWFTGNIGFHHIHHLCPRIPNYLLKRCHDENPSLQNVTVLTLSSSLRSASLHLWDEDSQRLVGFQQLRATPTPSTQS